MTLVNTQTVFSFLGTSSDDNITDGHTSILGDVLDLSRASADSVNGLEGDDSIETGLGNDLAAGDMVGDEWRYVEDAWVYTPTDVVVSNYGASFNFDDVIRTGAGQDVLLGNWGDDSLFAGAGDDVLNGGRGADHAFGGFGNDTLNLEDGNDYAEGGLGNDIVNGGAGDDEIHGDDNGLNLLDNGTRATTFAGLSATGGWTFADDRGAEVISQSANTKAGETYKISFDLAANLSGGHSAAMVEVLWNGDIVDTVQTQSGAYTTFTVDVVSAGDQGELSFRALNPVDATTYDHSGEIVSYQKSVFVGGEDATVAAFAPGQAKLYQVIDGQLHVFDTVANTYTAVGEAPGFKINAIGFNAEDDLIYGVAKSNGIDALGNAVGTTDIVMIDANGAAYRVGDGVYGDYVGDFDGSGNLWTFHTALNRISVVDVDSVDAEGNPEITFHHFPSNMFADRTYDLAYDAKTNAFLAVVSPTRHGGDGKVVRIDVDGVGEGGQPTFTEVPITGTLVDGEMHASMTKGAYGAVFFDGDGNLYYGLNSGDADMDQATANSGGIFKVNVDWDKGTAFAEFMSEAPATGSNDGAVDPRSSDAFLEVDADAAVLLRDPVLTLVEGGNDSLRGGSGDDLIHGHAGDDDLNGGDDDDSLFGDEGADNILGASGDDYLSGGVGNDSLQGGRGHDDLNGDDGTDYLHGGTGDDVLNGGAGRDKMVGGSGSDTLEGGAGNDHIWGGDWRADEEADVFVFRAGMGRDFVHDFEAVVDVLDFTSYDTDLETVMTASQDQGWATIIDMSQLDGGAIGDRLILKAVDIDTLGMDNFLF